MTHGQPTRIGVMIPTFDHGPMVRFAIRSVLDQDLAPAEVLVVGDGAPDATAATVLALGAADARVRWLPYPKGERHGERSRHDVLTKHTDVDAVFYLGDDDVWFPDHLARLVPRLADHDCVFGLDTRVQPDGSMKGRIHDLDRPAYRARLLENDNRSSLSSFGHRMDAYRSLPEGWRPAPPDINTDTFMYQQFIAAGATATSGLVPTVLHLGTAPRRRMPLAEREAELESYATAMGDPSWRWDAVDSKLFDWVQRQASMFEERTWQLADERDDAARENQQELDRLERRHASELARLTKDLDSGRVAARTVVRKLTRRLVGRARR
ncbi:MAG: glycosyltransferase family A protein [Acidimicrobiales bacterium]